MYAIHPFNACTAKQKCGFKLKGLSGDPDFTKRGVAIKPDNGNDQNLKKIFSSRGGFGFSAKGGIYPTEKKPEVWHLALLRPQFVATEWG